MDHGRVALGGTAYAARPDLASREQQITVAEHLTSRMLLQVHDEIVLELAPDERAQVEAIVREQMAGAYPLRAPLDVSVGVGANWEAAAH